MPTFFERLTDLVAAGVPLVTVTVVDTAGSVPQDRGAKMIVTADGLDFGTVGGGKIETRAIEEALKVLRGEEPERTRFVSWNLNKDIGMTCGGVVRLFFEAINVTSWRVAVFGAGHVAQALTRVLLNLDCDVTCFDPRPSWLEKLPVSPRLTVVHAPEMPAQVAAVPPGTFVALMTMGHATDKPILTEILKRRDLPYVGVIGSHSKAIVLRRELAEAGWDEERLQSFHCPIGLDIGSNHPYEIAVSIIAQMLKVRG